MPVTQDKDFNEAFRRKFENFEVIPSQAVWRGIASELDKAGSGKKEKVFPMFWLMAAASVLVVLSIGVWLFSPQEKIQLHGKAKEPVEQEQLVSVDPIPTVSQQKTISLKSDIETPLNTSAQIQINRGESIIQQRPIIQETSRSQEITFKEIEPARTDVQDNMPVKDEKAFASAEQPILASANERIPATALNLKDNNQAQPRIKTITDVVNFFVGKIDPREDKLIKFVSDGDGGTAVSGLNLGFVRIKSRNK